MKETQSNVATVVNCKTDKKKHPIVFKFGGDSVKNSEGMRNLAKIVASYSYNNIVVVVSAMGKTTNALEMLMNLYFNNWNEEFANFSFEQLTTSHTKISANDFAELKYDNIDSAFSALYAYHRTALDELFTDSNLPDFQNLADFNTAKEKLNAHFITLLNYLKQKPSKNYDYEYDQIVSYGEILSTTIISEYMNSVSVKNLWVDIRKVIKTDDYHREPSINWELSGKLAHKVFQFTNEKFYIVQGFLGSSPDNHTTTLGRDGSDYSAAIIANLLTAEKVIIWKDVEGIFNADPKYYAKSEKLEMLSYNDAVELTYFGAKVIHPKTIKPLQYKNIPLYVKSYNKPEEVGTLIAEFGRETLRKARKPVIIAKRNQVLISIMSNSEAVLKSEDLGTFFGTFNKLKIKENYIFNADNCFHVCFENNDHLIGTLVTNLEKSYKVNCSKGVDLLTVQNYNDTLVSELTDNKRVLHITENDYLARIVLQ